MNTSKLILWGHHQPDTKIRQMYQKKGNYRPLLMKADAEIFNKMLVNQI